MMTEEEGHDHAPAANTRFGGLAATAFLKVETFAYMALGLLLALTTLAGIVSASGSLWTVVQQNGDPNSIVVTIDRLLFVLMLVEILHTVRVSFKSGTLVCEPFLIVGLIASIRRVLVITLKSSEASRSAAAATPGTQHLLTANMLELLVLCVLILVMVISIVLLRRSEEV